MEQTAARQAKSRRNTISDTLVNTRTIDADKKVRVDTTGLDKGESKKTRNPTKSRASIASLQRHYPSSMPALPTQPIETHTTPMTNRKSEQFDQFPSPPKESKHFDVSTDASNKVSITVDGRPRKALDKNYRSSSQGCSQNSSPQTIRQRDQNDYSALHVSPDLTPRSSKRTRFSQKTVSPFDKDHHSTSDVEEAFEEQHVSTRPATPPSPDLHRKSVMPQSKQRSSSAPVITAVNTGVFSVPDATNSEDSPCDSRGPATRKSTSVKWPLIPNFNAKNQHHEVMETTYNVFNLMKESIAKKDQDMGCIYILRIKDYPGFVKIGRTTQSSIRTRLNQIQKCVSHSLELVDADHGHSRITYHQRIEQLIHKELWSHHQCFSCPCKQKQKAQISPRRPNSSNTRKHGEWFEISEEKAIGVVRRWKQWISSDPYCNGLLKPSEVLRIDTHADNPAPMESMLTHRSQSWHNYLIMLLFGVSLALDGQNEEVEDRQDEPKDVSNPKRCEWNWDFFFQLSGGYLTFLEKHHWFFGRRPSRKVDCSRWESLCKHWGSNILYLLLVSLVCTVSSSLTQNISTSGSAVTVLNVIVLGASGILYAA